MKKIIALFICLITLFAIISCSKKSEVTYDAIIEEYCSLVRQKENSEELTLKNKFSDDINGTNAYRRIQ